MAFWNQFLKKQKKEEAKTSDAGSHPKAERISSDTRTSDAGSHSRKGRGILLKSHITEKAGNALKENSYVFAIGPTANKKQVANAVEERYTVQVKRVNIINLPDKMRMRGRQIGWKTGLRKAIVKVKEGQTIDVQ